LALLRISSPLGLTSSLAAGIVVYCFLRGYAYPGGDLGDTLPAFAAAYVATLLKPGLTDLYAALSFLALAPLARSSFNSDSCLSSLDSIFCLS